MMSSTLFWLDAYVRSEVDDGRVQPLNRINREGEGVFFRPPRLPLRFSTGVYKKTVTLGRLITGEKEKFNELYDFGDGWGHEILVEAILPVKRGPGIRSA